MDILIRNQYKVIRVLRAEPDYAAMLAVDILDREKTEYLLNVYEGPLLRRVLPALQQLEGCRTLRTQFIWEGSLIAVFDDTAGQPIDAVFCRGNPIPRQLRLAMTEQLFRETLCICAYPPELSCSLLLSEQVRIFPQEKKLRLRWLLCPMEEMNERELVFLLGDQLRKLLLTRWDSPTAERKFLRALQTRSWKKVTELYAFWKECSPGIEAEYQKLEKKNPVARTLSLTWVNLCDLCWRLKHRKGTV